MMWRRYLAGLLLTGLLVSSASAGINLFGKKPKPPEPAVRVPELLGILKSDPDEHKRAAAAEELREFDGQAFPEMIPVLIEALAQDAKASVRAEAAQTLGKLRPISQNAGHALEQSLAKDSSMRVRLQARSALLSYNWAGYKPKNKDTPPLYQTGEPPLADPLPSPPAKTVVPQPMPASVRPAPMPVRKTVTPVAQPQPLAPRPLPQAPKPVLTPPPQQGPDLGLPPQ